MAAACTLGYANALDADFVYDDLVNITQRSALHWSELGVEPFLRALAESPSKRPVAIGTFGLHYYLGAAEPRDFRIVNIAIHAVNGLLVWAFATLVFGRMARLRGQASAALSPRAARAAALLAALLFVAHPLQTQSVTYIVQRMNALAATFHLAAILLYVAGRHARGWRRGLAWLAAALSWLLGIGSKETALMAAVAALLYEWYFERDLDTAFARRAAMLLLVVALPTLVVAFVVIMMTGFDPLAMYPPKDFSLFERALSEPRVVLFYLSQTFAPWPGRQSLLHEFAVSHTPFSPWTTLPALALVAALAWLAVGSARRRRLLSFAIAWLFVHLAIESSVIPLALAMEHRMYLPLVGLCLWAAYAGAARFQRAPALGFAAAALLVGGLLFATHVRNRAWQSPEALWTDVIAKYPDHYAAHLNLGFDLSGQGRYVEALEVNRRAAALDPSDSKARTNVASNLSMLGRLQEAEEHYRQALRLDPSNPLAHEGLGNALVRLGRPEEALPHFAFVGERWRRSRSWVLHGRTQLLLGAPTGARESFTLAAELAPEDAEPQLQLGIAALQLGELDEAIARFEAALARDESAETHAHLGRVHLRRGAEARALHHLERAEVLAPDSPEAINQLAWLLATASDERLRDPKRALDLVRRAARAVGSIDAGILDTTAAALAASGRFEEAHAVAEQARVLAVSTGDETLARELHERAALYASGRAYVEPKEGS